MADDNLDDDLTPKPTREDARGTPPGKGIIAPPHGGRIGNPPFVPTEEQREKVRQYAKTFPIAGERHIAVLMGFSRDTLRRHFGEDLELGRAQMLAAIGAQMVSRAVNAGAVGADQQPVAKGDLDAQKFVLARLGGWSTKVEVAGRDGGPIESVDLSRLTPDQLESYGRLAAAAAGMDPDSVVDSDKD
jgi:hypothetical protein